MYTAFPKVATNPALSHVFITGIVSSENKIDAYYVSASGNEAIDFPVQDVANASAVEVRAAGQWVYLRNLANTIVAAGENDEIIYGIQENIILSEALRYKIPATEEADWIATHLSLQSDGSLSITTRFTESSATVVKVEEKEAVISLLSVAMGDEDASVVIDGKIKLCDRGCKNCDANGECKSCANRFVLKSDTCLPCAENCKKCAASNQEKCTSCIKGAYLSDNSCFACDSNCSRCQGSATNCTACRRKYYVDGGVCTKCPKDCKKCDSSGCNKCRGGFTIDTDTGRCITCLSKCLTCTKADRGTCLSCGRGYEKVGGECKKCPVSCKKCKDGKCGKCVRGFHPSQDKLSCVKDCELPCLTCVDGSPTSCLSCDSGADPVNNQCIIDSTCNDNNECTDCPRGLNKVKMGAS